MATRRCSCLRFPSASVSDNPSLLADQLCISSYVFWDSIFQFLKTLDPEVPLYLGSATPGQRDDVGYGTHFANGGPGYVLSRGAMKKLLHRETDRIGRFIGPNFHDKWREEVARERCGDSILGMVLWKSGIEMQSLYPMFTQHVFHTLPFDLMRWCSPIFTFHKPVPDQMHNVSRFEYGIRSHDVSCIPHLLSSRNARRKKKRNPHYIAYRSGLISH